MDDRLRREARWAGLFALSLGISGCAALSGRSPLMEGAPNVRASVPELRAELRGLAARMPGIVEQAADRVLRSPDPALRRRVLVFRINAISNLQQALFLPDPLAALIDVWALVFQMRDALARAAPDRTGAVNRVTDEMTRRLEGEIERVVQRVAPTADLPTVRRRVEAWAREHPTQGILAVRESTEPLLTSLRSPKTLGALAAVSSLAETGDDIVSRIDFYASELPKLGRWQAEFLIDDALAGPKLRVAATELPRVLGSLDRVADVVERGPALVEAIDQRLVATVDFVRGEHDTIAADLHRGRVAASEDVEARARRLVDHVFVRAAQILGGIAILAVVALAALWAILASHRSGGVTPGR